MAESCTYIFGPFHFDDGDRLLSLGTEPVPLPPKAALTLSVLLRNAPKLVEKDELLKQVWPDSFVEEGNLAHNISLLRKTLGTNGGGKPYIETVPRRGYRFAGAVQCPDAAAGSAPAPHGDTVVAIAAPRRRPWPSLLRLAIASLAVSLVATVGWHDRANSSVQPPADRGGTRNPAAYQEYLNGCMYYTRHDPESLHRSAEAFERAVALDRGYAAAYAGLAEAYLVLGEHESTDVAYERTRIAATTALELDPDLPQAHTVLAFNDGMLRWRWAEGEARFRRALALDPRYTLAHILFAIMLDREGRTDEALKEAQRALEIEPFHETLPWLFATIYYHRRNYDKALEWIRKGETAGVDFGLLPQLGAVIFALESNCSRALSVLKNKLPETRERMGSNGYVMARCGRDSDARMIESRLRNLNGVDGAANSYFAAMIEIGLGHNSAALTDLEAAYAGRTGYVPRIKTDPVFDPIRNEARFKAVLRNIGLADSAEPHP